jgi:imidazolonepropionase-like amidohydrolase
MTLVLRGATLLDGTGRDPIPRATVLVEDGRITRVDGDVPRGAQVLELDGLTLHPGLIDAHVHLGASTDLERTVAWQVSVAEIAAAIFRNCAQTLEAGFTTVRDTGGTDGGLVRVMEKGLMPGPRIVCCGPLLCQTGGHGQIGAEWEPSCRWHEHQIPGLYSLSLLSDGPDEVRRNAREAFRRGGSFLKMCVTGGVVSRHAALTDTQFTVEEIRAAVIEAEARSTYVTVHAHNNRGIRNAVEAGARCVEHGTSLDEATARMMRDQGVSLVPTLAVTVQIERDVAEIGLPPVIAERVRGTREAMSEAVRIARAEGLRVGSGSDLIGPNQRDRGLELVLRSDILSPMEALVSATRTNAEILGLADRLGTVETGMLADLCAIEGNPLDKPELWNDRDRVRLVVKEGRVVKDTRA